MLRCKMKRVNNQGIAFSGLWTRERSNQADCRQQDRPVVSPNLGAIDDPVN